MLSELLHVLYDAQQARRHLLLGLLQGIAVLHLVGFEKCLEGFKKCIKLHLKVRVSGMPKGSVDSMTDMPMGIRSMLKVRGLNDHGRSVRHDMLHKDGQDLSCQLLLRLQSLGQKHCEPGKLAEPQHDAITWEVGHMAASAKWHQAALGDRGEINVPDQNKPGHAAGWCCLAWRRCTLLSLLLAFPEMEDGIPNGTAFPSKLKWHALKVIKLLREAVAQNRIKLASHLSRLCL